MTRHHQPAVANRLLLGLIGLLLLLGGLVGLLIAVGQAVTVSQALGGPATMPAAGDATLPGAATGFTGAAWFPWALGGAGLLVAVLALVWLAAQVPKVGSTRSYRVADDESGLTQVAPKVLATAVQDDVTQVPGVTAANATLGGDLGRSELDLRVTVGSAEVLPQVVSTIRTTVVRDLGTALGVDLHRLVVQLEISPDRPAGNTITL